MQKLHQLPPYKSEYAVAGGRRVEFKCIVMTLLQINPRVRKRIFLKKTYLARKQTVDLLPSVVFCGLVVSACDTR